MRVPTAAALLLLMWCCCFTCGSEGAARPTLRKRTRGRQAGRPVAVAEPDAAAAAPSVAQQPSAAGGFTTAAVTATFDVIVVGAGLSGLKAAADLKAKGFRVQVLEGRSRVGGRVYSTTLTSGTSVEIGAQWFHGTDATKPDLMCVRNIATASLGITPVSSGTSNLLRQTSSSAVVADDASYWTLYNNFWSWANAKTWTNADSIQMALTSYATAKGLTAAQKAGLAYVVNTELEQEYGASVSQLSMEWWDEGLNLPGGDSIMPSGQNLGKIPAFLASTLAANIQLNSNVTNIAYSSAGGVTVTAVVSGSTVTYAAKAVIVTVPLGVLKQRGSSLFSPALPAAKLNAISRLGFGLLNKVILEWPSTYAGLPFANPDSGKFWVNRLPLTSGDTGRWQEFFQISRALPGSKLLVAFQAGLPAVTAETTLTDAATVTSLLAQLQTWYTTSLPTPTATYVTRWWTDPWSFGSYSVQAPGCTGNERAAFGTPEPSGAGSTPRVWFAGEHVSVNYPSTMQGAFLTGRDAAAAVALKHAPTP